MGKQGIESYINKIHCADCLDFMKDWPDNRVDLVLTDPPYEFESKNPAGGGFMDRENKKHLDKIGKSFGFNFEPLALLLESDRLCNKLNGYFFTNKKLVPIYLGYAEKNQCKWDILLWRKPNPVPIFNAHYLIDKEYIIYIKRSGAFFGGTSDYNKYFTIKSHRVFQGLSGHPTEKPLAIISELIEVSTKPNDLILDPFCGSGTTCVAAKMLGRRYIGIDISEEYCNIARMRLKAVETGVPVAEQKQGQIGLFE